MLHLLSRQWLCRHRYLAMAHVAVLMLIALTDRAHSQAIFETRTHRPILSMEDALETVKRVSGRQSLVVVEVDGPEIRADFVPTGLVFLSGGSEIPVTCDQLANRFGYDHFNWVQTYIDIPSHWSMYSYLTNPRIDGTLLNTPILDPVISHPPNQYAYFSTYADSWGIIENQINKDRWPFYYNEPIRNSYIDIARTIPVDDRFFTHFYDAPRNGFMFFQPGEAVEFQTDLAAVRSNLTYDTFQSLSIGASFRWKSDTTFIPTGSIPIPGGGGVFFESHMAVLMDNSLPPVTSGGIFDVRFDYQVIPEPGSLVLLSLGTVAILGYGWPGGRGRGLRRNSLGV